MAVANFCFYQLGDECGLEDLEFEIRYFHVWSRSWEANYNTTAGFKELIRTMSGLIRPNNVFNLGEGYLWWRIVL